MADGALPLDLDASFTATLTGQQWLHILSGLTSSGAHLTEPGVTEKQLDLGLALLDTAADIVKQIDPGGWAETALIDGHG